MEDNELARATWRKATRSQGNGACVEVAGLTGGRIAVHDSKDPAIPPIIMTAGQWLSFLSRARKTARPSVLPAGKPSANRAARRTARHSHGTFRPRRHQRPSAEGSAKRRERIRADPPVPPIRPARRRRPRGFCAA